ncbi:MAG: Omp28-related outer membrane protein [Bacteroidales bacterium]|nr:Omp28-related outer membrane protein [Bacteroidales bacterium]MCF8403150.1 Omp28-related outer membrane protein [Bacteroidales bacterium]
MKNIYLVFLSLMIFSLFSCNKKEDESPQDDGLSPVKEQWGFALNYTATWCGPCGAWGAPLIHDYAEQGKVVAITAHASGDPMHKATLYNSFENVRTDGGGIPAFWVGDKKTTNLGDMVTLLAETPTAGIALQYEISGANIAVKTKTKFFDAGSGDYYLSVLVLESGIDGSSSSGAYAQNGTSTPATYQHDFVLRASAVDGNAYGELIATDPAKDAAFTKDYTIPFDEAWDNDVYVVAILWNKDLGSTPVYKFVNAVQ